MLLQSTVGVMPLRDTGGWDEAESFDGTSFKPRELPENAHAARLQSHLSAACRVGRLPPHDFTLETDKTTNNIISLAMLLSKLEKEHRDQKAVTCSSYRD